MRTDDNDLQQWCKDNNIIYRFFLEVMNTINNVALAHNNIEEINLKLPVDIYHMLEPIIYAVYNHLTMRWVGDATYENLFTIHGNSKNRSVNAAYLDPDVVIYDDSDVGLAFPMGKERPVYVSFMPPYLIPLGIDRESGVILSYIPLENMIPITYMEYSFPYPS